MQFKSEEKVLWSRLISAAMCAMLLIVFAVPPSATAQEVTPQLRGDWMRGAAIVQSPNAPFGSPASYESLQRLRATGADWVSVVATFHVASWTSVEFYRAPSDPTVEAVGAMMDTARSLGFRVMLQPIVLSADTTWNGLFWPSDRALFLSNYGDFLLPYATRAQQAQAELFCIGTEFYTLSKPEFSANWADVVTKVRGAYSGALTYSANWGDKQTPEFATIDWWNLVDYIGISAYFPLSWNNFETESLRQGWFSYTDPFGGTPAHMPGVYYPGQTYRWHEQLQALNSRWNKPVIFTRIGFASSANSPGRWDVPYDGRVALGVQANGYEATFRAWQQTGWLRGTFWTPWHSDPDAGGPLDNSETPQNKPAQEVMQRWYSGR